MAETGEIDFEQQAANFRFPENQESAGRAELKENQDWTWALEAEVRALKGEFDGSRVDQDQGFVVYPIRIEPKQRKLFEAWLQSSGLSLPEDNNPDLPPPTNGYYRIWENDHWFYRVGQNPDYVKPESKTDNAIH